MTTEYYPATSLIGGAAGALDAIPSVTLGDADVAIVTTSVQAFRYFYDSAEGAAENSPLIIKPDDIGVGNGRWKIVASEVYLADAKWIGIGPALERLEFYTAGYAAFMGCNVGIETATPLAPLTVDKDGGEFACALFRSGGAGNYFGIDTSGADVYLQVGGATSIILKGGGNVSIGIVPSANIRFEAYAPDAQSTIVTAGKFSTLSDAASNYGIYGSALGGGGTNNIGVFGASGNAANNYPFKDSFGNYSAAARWEDVSDPERKTLIRDLKPGEDNEFYSMLNGFHIKGYRMKAEVPIIGYSETEVEINDMGEEMPKPILGDPELIRELFGLLANDPDLPEFIPGLDKKGIGAGGIASYLIVICQYQKKLISDLEQRTELLEAA